MILDNHLKPIIPKPVGEHATAQHVVSGTPIPKQARLKLFSPTEWEEFIEEWAESLNGEYTKVRRLGGAGDFGVDIVGFVSDRGWEDEWDNYQCKRYKSPLTPSDIWVEVGKVVYYSYKGEYTIPRKYYFVASQGIGTTLEQLLGNKKKFKDEARSNWTKHCQDGITKTTSIPLEGDLFGWFEEFNFDIFSSKSYVELINEHSKTVHHIVRFGGGLPARPEVAPPPEEHGPEETRYVQQLLEAYQDHLAQPIKDVTDLSQFPTLKKDLQMQRERFYHAEELRNYARDTLPSGTFDKLQDEIFHGVIDICDLDHKNGYIRMKTTITQATNTPLTSNPLITVVKVPDKQGICHQLANENRLAWVPESGET